MRQLAELLAAYVHVELQRSRVGMYRHHGHLRRVLVEVEAVGDQLRLPCLDQVHELSDPRLELLERVLSDIGMVDLHDGLSCADRSVAGHANLPSMRSGC